MTTNGGTHYVSNWNNEYSDSSTSESTYNGTSITSNSYSAEESQVGSYVETQNHISLTSHYNYQEDNIFYGTTNSTDIRGTDIYNTTSDGNYNYVSVQKVDGETRVSHYNSQIDAALT